MSDLWTSICNSRKDPNSVRKLEAHLKELNDFVSKLTSDAGITGSYSIEPRKYHSQINLAPYAEDLPVAASMFEQQIIPAFYLEFRKWEALHKAVQTETLAEVFKILKISKKEADKFQHHISWTVWNDIRLLRIMQPIPASVFAELFEAGLIAGWVVTPDSHLMLKSVDKYLEEFYMMIKNEERRSLFESELFIVRVFSAPPLFRSQAWKTIREFKQKQPVMFPSIHLVQESTNWDQEMYDIFCPSIDAKAAGNFRAMSLVRIRTMLTHRPMELAIWREEGRFIFLQDNRQMYRPKLVRKMGKPRGFLRRQMNTVLEYGSADAVYDNDGEEEVLIRPSEEPKVKRPLEKGEASTDKTPPTTLPDSKGDVVVVGPM